MFIVSPLGRAARLLALCGAALAALPPVHAEPALAFDEALLLAQARSQQLPAQDAAANAARELAVAAGTRPDPTLKAGLNNLPIDGPDRYSVTRDFMTMRSIGVAQEFTRTAKRQARAARYGREAEVAEAGRSLAIARLQRDTAIAWLDRHHQQRLVDLLRAQRGEAALQIEAADAAYRGGRGTQADALAARAALAQMDDRIDQAERELATATTRLARWIGDAPAARTLAAPPATDTVQVHGREELERVIDRHPELAVMVGQEQVAQAEAEVARSEQRADWSAEVMFSQRGPSYSNMVSINVSIPLQLDQKNRQQRELSARLSVVEQRRAEREEATREHLADIKAWLQQWQSNRERLARYERTLLPLAAERKRAALSAYQGGPGALAAVLEARRAEIDVRMERVRLEAETGRLWAQLTYLIPLDAGR